jgi:hypothetical protein
MTTKTFITALLLTWILPTAVLHADDPVKITYQSAIKTVKSSKISDSARKNLRQAVRKAWELYMGAEKDDKEKAIKELARAKKFVGADNNGIPRKQRPGLVRVLSDFSRTIDGQAPAGFAILKLKAVDGPDGPPLKDGEVFVDGVLRGKTAPDGNLKLLVRPGSRSLEVRKYPSSAGLGEIVLKAGNVKAFEIVILDGKDFSEDAELAVDQAPDGVLDGAFTELRLRMSRPNGATVALKDIDRVSLVDPNGGAPLYLTAMIKRNADGTLEFKDPDGIRTILADLKGMISINVVGEDKHLKMYNETVDFYMGAYRVNGRLVAPPSNPGLLVQGIEVTGRILNSSLVFVTKSDANGKFSFPKVPAGNLEFDSETQQNGIFYYGQGVVVMNGSKSLTVNMLAAEDLNNGVDSFTVEELTALTLPAPSPAAAGEYDQGKIDEIRRDREVASQRQFSPVPPPRFVAPNEVTVTATAAAQGVPVTDTANLSVEKGVKKIQLRYKVSTAEYPTYVLSNSIYNDSWSLMVRGGTSGKQLVAPLTRQINTQLSVFPVWQSDGTTGEITKTIDVSSLTVNAAAEITVFVSAMNVGDSALATTVTATLGADSGVTINKLSGDSSVPLNFHSIPLPGSKNHFDRFIIADITRPKTSKIKKVTATLVNQSSEIELVSSAPDGKSVIEESESKIRINVAFKSSSVQITNPDPPFHTFKIRVKLVVDVDGNEVSDEKETGDRKALWRMPSGFARYSPSGETGRDAGGDDWSSKGTFGWLKNNSSLITKINDISGEHGRNIRHSTHKHGTDLDIYHFYTFPNAVTGGDNYNKLQDAVLLAASKAKGADKAKARVVSWISASRKGIDDFAAKSEVIQVIYIKGDPVTDQLKSGWGEELLTTGKTAIKGKDFVFTSDSWTSAKYVSDRSHNDHVHITLSRPALGE